VVLEELVDQMHQAVVHLLIMEQQPVVLEQVHIVVLVAVVVVLLM
jgi:hypothetical protein